MGNMVEMETPPLSRGCRPRDKIGGSDGDRLREIDVVAPPLVPFLCPEPVLRSRSRRGAGRYAADFKVGLVPQDRWPEILERANHESLRRIGRELGVSHETVRSILCLAARGDAPI